MWKDFLYFSRKERRGIIALVILIALVIAFNFIYPTIQKPHEPIHLNNEKAEKDYNEFVASLKEKKEKEKTTYPTYSFKEKQRNITLQPFDPNTADSLTFVQLGLPAWMAKNIMSYRSKGGKFKKKEDFRKVYGMTDEQFTTLQPWIQIHETSLSKDTVRLITKEYRKDTVQVFKYPAGTVIDLNEADTTELKKVPGIGSGIAKRIVAYRKQLGGFYTINQLSEIDLDVNQLTAWFRIEDGKTNRLNLNKVSIERLRSHPYFNFYQAKAIVEYRKKKGEVNSLKQFSLLEEFTEDDFDRMQHYVCFQ